jgi:hypothetical protein
MRSALDVALGDYVDNGGLSDLSGRGGRWDDWTRVTSPPRAVGTCHADSPETEPLPGWSTLSLATEINFRGAQQGPGATRLREDPGELLG